VTQDTIHILGAGSLGRMFANRLAVAGFNPCLLLRPEKFNQSNTLLTLNVENLHTETTGIPRLESSMVQSEPVDGSLTGVIKRLLVVTKGKDVCEGLANLLPRCDSNTIVMVLCNGGLAVREEISQHPALNHLYVSPGSTIHGAFRQAEETSETLEQAQHHNVVHAGWGNVIVGHPVSGESAKQDDYETNDEVTQRFTSMYQQLHEARYIPLYKFLLSTFLPNNLFM